MACPERACLLRKPVVTTWWLQHAPFSCCCWHQGGAKPLRPLFFRVFVRVLSVVYGARGPDSSYSAFHPASKSNCGWHQWVCVGSMHMPLALLNSHERHRHHPRAFFSVLYSATRKLPCLPAVLRSPGGGGEGGGVCCPCEVRNVCAPTSSVCALTSTHALFSFSDTGCLTARRKQGSTELP